MKQYNNKLERKFLMTDQFGQEVFQQDMVYFNSWQPGASEGWDYYTVEPIYGKIDDITDIIGVNEYGKSENIAGFTVFMPYSRDSIEIAVQREIMKVNVDRLIPSKLSFSQLIEDLNRMY